MTALDRMVTQDIASDPMSVLAELPGEVPVIVEDFPINDQLKMRVQQMGGMVPMSLAEIDVCSPDFIYVVPPALEPIVGQICTRRAELEALFDDLVTAMDTIPSMSATINSVENTVDSIDDTVDDIFCIVDPGCP